MLYIKYTNRERLEFLYVSNYTEQKNQIWTGVQVMVRTKGPGRPKLAEKILRELAKHPKGIWMRKLARNIKEPTATVHRYVTIDKDGYPGEKIEIVKRLPTERGGNIILRLKRK